MATRQALALVAAALLLGGCSATKLAYNNLDTLVSWEVGKFVDLSGPSEDLFDAGFQTLWTWHRGTQLPLYASDLRELAQATDGPLSAEQIRGYIQRAQDHVDRAVAQGLPDGAQVLAALDDPQVAALLRRMDKRRSERIEERREMAEAGLREQSRERLLASLKRWLGSLTPEQKSQVAEWAGALRVDLAAEVAASQDWGAAFAALLAERQAPDFQAKLAAILNGERDTEARQAINAVYDHNQATAIALLSQVSHGLTPRQRRHLRDELEELAADLEQLTAIAAAE